MTMRMEPLRVALAQMNATVGDIEGNAKCIRDLLGEARDDGARLVLFPELALTGYPPDDLLLKTHFVDAAGEALQEIAGHTEGIVALIGFPERADDVYNSLAVVADGEIHAIYRKEYLPNYGVFDEHRYFQAGTQAALAEINGIGVGLTVCEDIWEPGPPVTTIALSGAQVLANISASPYHQGKPLEREQMLIQRARDNACAVLFCNLVGGQDELIFDGGSVVIDQEGEVLARGPLFEEALVCATIDPGAVAAVRLRDARHRAAVRRSREREEEFAETIARVSVDNGEARDLGEVGGPVTDLLSPEEEVYQALVTGVRDYVRKNGFERVVLGLSGGIDSTLVALIAVDALGKDAVTTVVMPSKYSSEGTQNDARQLAKNLGTQLIELEINDPVQAYEELLAGEFEGRDVDVTEENLQARVRGNLLMALSNKFGWLVLTTGNKSEMSVGYATLYGDMAGGFAVLKDVFKMWVYRLTDWRNQKAGGDLVPPEISTRPPSAELAAEQKDEDSLPPYEVLDKILEGYVERDLDADQLVRLGLPREDVERVIRMVDLAEYKRRQAPPGIRISTRAFGRDRRLPITNRFGR
jgi:NAD+ synthase (glutamine-hydrolysing)